MKNKELIEKIRIIEAELNKKENFKKIIRIGKIKNSLAKIETSIQKEDEAEIDQSFKPIIYIFLSVWSAILSNSVNFSSHLSFLVELGVISKHLLSSGGDNPNLKSVQLAKVGIRNRLEFEQSLNQLYIGSNIEELYKNIEETEYIEIIEEDKMDEKFLRNFSNDLSENQISEEKGFYDFLNKNFYE